MPGYVERYYPGKGRSGEALCQIVPDGYQLNLWGSQEYWDGTKRIALNGSESKDKPNNVIIGEVDGFTDVMIGNGISQRPQRITSTDPHCIPGYSPELGADVAVWSTPTKGADYLIFNALALTTQRMDVTDAHIDVTGFSIS